MLDETHRRTYATSIVAQSLDQLHEFVTRQNARIEMTRAGSDERCVLISKQELDALERALEILSDTEDVRHLSSKLAHIAGAVTAGGYAHA